MIQTSLTGEQWDELRVAVMNGFVGYEKLIPPIRRAFNIKLNTIVTEKAPFGDQVTQLIDWAEATDKVRELVRALRGPNGNPWNPKLEAFERTLDGVGGFDQGLEKLLYLDPGGPTDTAAWRLAMSRAESAVCRIEYPANKAHNALGTGFLIGPDLVLTNRHVEAVFETNPSEARFRFDYRTREDRVQDDGTPYALAADWQVRSSGIGKLDYSIVRLNDNVGEQPNGRFLNAPCRGWLALGLNRPAPGQPLFVLQHPKGATIKVAQGILAAGGDWLDYQVDTECGSSGSPILDSLWNLVGLHSRAGDGRVNRGAAAAAIYADLPAMVRALLRPSPPR